MPLWYVPRAGEIWIYTYAKSQKVRNLEARPARHPSDRDRLRVPGASRVEVEAEAEIHRDLDTVFELARELTVRYSDDISSV